MNFDYYKLLESAKKNIPESISTTERFEMPKAIGHIQGNKTIINNFLQICDTLRREPSHLLKYLQRELAAPAEIEKSRLILGRKILPNIINKKIEQYANEFVLCYECKKPDTILKKEDRIITLKCTACGAKHPVISKI